MIQRKIKSYVIGTLCALFTTSSVAILFTLIALIAKNGLPAIDWEFLTSAAKRFGSEGGICYQIIGTVLLISTAALIGLPLALGTAVYQTEFLSSRWQKPANILLYSLNGVPTILFGLFGFIIFGVYFKLGISWLSGALILALMILPTIAVSIKESIQSIPNEYRETANAFGFSQWQLIQSVILPYSLSGVLTGTLLGLARAAGETAAIMFTATTFSGVTIPSTIYEPVTSLQTHILILSQDALAPEARTHAWGAALVLVSIVFILNISSMMVRRKTYKGSQKSIRMGFSTLKPTMIERFASALRNYSSALRNYSSALRTYY